MNTIGTCPVCQGSCRMPAPSYSWKKSVAGYDEATDTFACTNCGGQYMYGTPKGTVKLNKEGVPCKHSYVSLSDSSRRSTYSVRYCDHCGDELAIDSGD